MVAPALFMNLYILRHGIAEENSSLVPGSDRERRLTTEGKKKMRRIAKSMRAMELDFDLILSSPYLRAHETAQIVAKVFSLEKLLELSPALAADGNPKQLIDELKQNYRKRGHVLLVGHEPYMSRLISLLISGDASIAVTLKKGGLCKLSVKAWRHGRCASLEWLLTPSQLTCRR